MLAERKESGKGVEEMILAVEQVTDSRRAIRSRGGKNNDGGWRGRRGARSGHDQRWRLPEPEKGKEEKGDTKRAGRTKTRVERREGQALGPRLISPSPCLRRSPSIHCRLPFPIRRSAADPVLPLLFCARPSSLRGRSWTMAKRGRLCPAQKPIDMARAVVEGQAERTRRHAVKSLALVVRI